MLWRPKELQNEDRTKYDTVSVLIFWYMCKTDLNSGGENLKFFKTVLD